MQNKFTALLGVTGLGVHISTYHMAGDRRSLCWYHDFCVQRRSVILRLEI